MPVDLQDSANAHIPNAIRLRDTPDNSTFVNVCDHLHESELAARFKNTSSSKKHVAVVLGYFDGQSYIRDQLHSILQQSHSAVHIYLCDDQSEPRFSLNDIRLDKDMLSKISLGIRSRKVGFANNFLNALANVPDYFEYFAFSDQDDIWDEDKLEKALTAFKKNLSNKPALYCARTEITDATCEKTLGYSPLFGKQPSFENALVQNIGGGNTMVFNKAARDLIVASSSNEPVVSHDWWCYQIITGAGGKVIYDPEPCLKYRQHGKNLVGANSSWSARLLRIRGLIQGRFRAWNDRNLKALSEHRDLLTEHNQGVLDDFIEARQQHFLKRLILFKRSGIYRQTLLGNMGLLLGILLNKV